MKTKMNYQLLSIIGHLFRNRDAPILKRERNSEKQERNGEKQERNGQKKDVPFLNREDNIRKRERVFGIRADSNCKLLLLN